MRIRLIFLLFFFKINIIYSMLVFSSSIDLYSITINVESKSEKHRMDVAKAALINIFVKITGEEDVLKRYPTLAQHTKNAIKYISSFSYYEENIDNDQNIHLKSYEEEILPYSTLIIKFNFEPQEIRRILIDAKAPFWGSKRPSTLVWFIHQSGSRKTFSNNDDFDFLNTFKEYAKFRGLPVTEPILDLNEISILNDEKHWDEIYNDIYLSSKKYKSDIIYIIKFNELSEGGWIALSSMKYENEIIKHDFMGEDINQFLKNNLNYLTSKLAEKFSIIGSNTYTNENYIIKISNINNYKQFSYLTQTLSSISALRSLKIKKINNEALYFSFPSSIQLKKLITIMSLNDRLIRIDQSLNPIPNGSVDLSYMWNDK